MNKKSGFTLAEVLVTLMIIGVIAAMTIPSLMQSTSSQEYKAAFKKAVSMLNQAVTLNYALDGEDASDYTGTNFVNLMKTRLNVMSEDSAKNAVYTADGMYFKAMAGGSCTDTDACAKVEVDVNGAKGPNKPTTATNKVFDIFTINIYAQKALPSETFQQQVLYSK